MRLKLCRYNLDREPHIKVNYQKCRQCEHRVCLTACPARCYLPEKEHGVAFNYEGCLECGTCFILCDKEALQWEFPKGGFGVSYRFS